MVAIGNLKAREIKLLDIVNALEVFVAQNTHKFLKGIIGKATAILKQGGKALAGFHLVSHRALNTA